MHRQLVADLAQFSVEGARAVVLFLRPADVERLVHAIQLAHEAGDLDTQQMVLLASTGWGDNTDQVSCGRNIVFNFRPPISYHQFSK